MLPDGQPVTGANFASLTQKDVYAKFPDVTAQNDQRKASTGWSRLLPGALT